MTKIKLCGIKRMSDIEAVNELDPEYIGFVFAKNSKRYVSPEAADALRSLLKQGIVPVGVFVDEKIETIAELLNRHIIEAVQLHGSEDEDYIRALRSRVKCPIIKAFCVESGAVSRKRRGEESREARTIITAARHSTADYVLLDSGSGSGETFDWTLIKEMDRPYFLAGGLNAQNVGRAMADLHPFGVDASSSLETDGFKDKEKMEAFVNAVRHKLT